MKKRISLVLVPFISLLASCSNNIHEIEDYEIDIEYKDNFKILQLTDLHFGTMSNMEEDFAFIDLSINESNPDLIVLTGDSFLMANKSIVNQTFDYFESKHINWTYIYGNHDEQGLYSSNYIDDVLHEIAQKDNSYCLFKNFDDNVEGDSNFIINLKDNGSYKFQLFFLDSNSYQYLDYIGYDYIYQDQIEWYENAINNTTLKTGKLINSFMFIHIPLPEYVDAYNAYTLDPSIGSGENRESPCVPKKNTGMFQKIKELDSTKAVFCGHDHINDSHILYEGIELCYGLKSTDNIYHNTDMMGSTLITIHDIENYRIDRLFHTYEELNHEV